MVLLGSAPCLYDDLYALPGYLDWPSTAYDFMAINVDKLNEDKGLIHMISYVASLDIDEHMPMIRKVMGRHEYKIISWVERDGVDIVVPMKQPVPVAPAGWSGSSSLLGALGAIQLGYTKVILAGCPLIGDIPNSPGMRYEIFQEGWRRHRAAVYGKVTSMSGWTADFLGRPTDEW